MRWIAGAAWASTSTTALGVLMLLAGVEVGVAVAAQSVGSGTPVEGVTLGTIGVLIAAGLGFAWTGSRMIFKLAGLVNRWEAAVAKVAANEARLDDMEKWRNNVEGVLAEMRLRTGLREMPDQRNGGVA